ncbi:MAG: response regulator [Parachlamydia sp.]|jgi:CheY-like chemotaxis protein|nr:response regulator [Parachlamydia sp.]
MKNKQILIVEDNEDNSLIVEKILNHYGYQTTVSFHGKAAMFYCETHLPDLILMDLSLPDMDGIELTRQLRKLPNFEKIPIIALTAHAMSDFLAASQKAGLNDYLTKPFLPTDLINLVKKYLE